MNKKGPKSVKMVVRWLAAVALSLIVVLGTSEGVRADEADAKRMLKAMSDYMAAQKSSSICNTMPPSRSSPKMSRNSRWRVRARVTLNRPDKILVTRAGGFADIEMSFDGKTLTLLGKKPQPVQPGSRCPGPSTTWSTNRRNTYHRPLPAADLLLSNPYDELMLDVVDIKDLGSGVVGGIECDYLAFRTNDVDWQIWIAQGEHPYPCRYVITSKLVTGGPQYTIQIRDWKTGGEVPETDFGFKNATHADKVELKDLKGTDALPDHFMKGDTK